ncbi:MAG: Na+/galactose cotransporter, partial [Bryobacterales bacterium]|nr:Na+/galactose cotransporter [Bryobacterales bacterium]
ASVSGYQMPVVPDGSTNYDLSHTTMMSEFYPSGMLGIGITALLASFMSGMAGNVTAFNTVFTYDIYQSYIRKNAPDAHYLWVGRMTTIVGTILSIGAAYVARQYNNINDILQLVFSFVNAPLLGTFLLGMFWKRTTANGAFWGLLLGTFSAAATHGLTVAENKGGWLGASVWEFSSSMAQNFWIAIVAWTVCFVMTIAISLVTRPKTDAELKDLVMGFTEHPPELALPWYRRPVVLGVIVLVCCLIFNVYFW